MRSITTVILLTSMFLSYGQSVIGTSYADKKSFTKTAIKHLKKYAIRSNVAYMDEDYEQAKFLYDSLVQHCLTGTYLENFKLNTIGKGKLFTEDIDIPMILTTNTTWCVLDPTKGEIPALNDVAHTNKKKLKVIALYWGRKEKVEEIAEHYDENIIVVYVDERDNRNASLVEAIKHTLGNPVTLFIDKDKKVVSIKRNSEEVKTSFSDDDEKAYMKYHQWYTDNVGALFSAEGKSTVKSDAVVEVNEEKK
ncbi:hypothetical protein ACFQ1M_09095 [Sungkyunkwania multivorans]|uniref:Uncharacterized protein n=1 Tax=Sungkyunkwania multivorans TaxID=1173618 RepID=A0ABW3D090_9FLAO